MTREQFFQCTFTVDGQRRTQYVRAWTASAARRATAEQLASEGVEVSGPIEAAPAGASNAPAVLTLRTSHA